MSSVRDRIRDLQAAGGAAGAADEGGGGGGGSGSGGGGAASVQARAREVERSLSEGGDAVVAKSLSQLASRFDRAGDGDDAGSRGLSSRVAQFDARGGADGVQSRAKRLQSEGGEGAEALLKARAKFEGGEEEQSNISQRAALFEKVESKPLAKPTPSLMSFGSDDSGAGVNKAAAVREDATRRGTANKAEEKSVHEQLREVKRTNEQLVSTLLELTASFKALEKTKEQLQHRLSKLENQ